MDPYEVSQMQFIFLDTAANCGNTEMVDPRRMTKRQWVPKAKEVVDEVEADHARGKQAQVKFYSPKETPKPLLSSNMYVILNSAEAKDCNLAV